MKKIVTKVYPDSNPKPPTFQVPEMHLLNLIFGHFVGAVSVT